MLDEESQAWSHSVFWSPTTTPTPQPLRQRLPRTTTPAAPTSSPSPLTHFTTPHNAFDYYSTYYSQSSLAPSTHSTFMVAPHPSSSMEFAHINNNYTNASEQLLLFSGNGSSSTASPEKHLCDVDHTTWQQWERATLLVCGLTGAIVIAVLKLCVILTFVKCAELRVSAQNLYILNLAICDFCVGINSLPGVTIYFYNMCWPLGVPLCQLMTNMDWITSTETGISMCLVALDRLRLVQLGAHYSQLENRSVVVYKILASWMLVICFLTPGFLIPLIVGESINVHGDCMNEIYRYEWLGTAMYSVTGAVPPIALVTLYTVIHRLLRIGGSTIRHHSERDAQRQLRAARGMTFLCAVFLASWIPSTLHEVVMWIVRNWPALQPYRLDERVEFRIMTFFRFWIYLNSLVNPFLYAFAFPAIRSAMEKTFLPTKWHRQLESRRRRLSQGGNNNGSIRNVAAAAKRNVTTEESVPLMAKTAGAQLTNTLRRLVSREPLSRRASPNVLSVDTVRTEVGCVAGTTTTSSSLLVTSTSSHSGGLLVYHPAANGSLTSFGVFNHHMNGKSSSTTATVAIPDTEQKSSATSSSDYAAVPSSSNVAGNNNSSSSSSGDSSKISDAALTITTNLGASSVSDDTTVPAAMASNHHVVHSSSRLNGGENNNNNNNNNNTDDDERKLLLGVGLLQTVMLNGQLSVML